MFTDGMPWDIIMIVILIGYTIGYLKSKKENNVK